METNFNFNSISQIWDDYKVLFVFSDDGHISCRLSFYDDTPQDAVISDLYVHESMRKQGGATAILNWCFKCAKDNGCNSISLRSDQDDWKLVKEKTSIKLTGKAIKQKETVVSIDEWELPDGYIFKNENGNVINATKIVLEKKKEYPKTYEECCKVLDFCGEYFLTTYDANCMVKKEVYRILQQVNSLTRLLICKLSYWKIAGDEMGLGEPWEPDYNNEKQPKYGLYDILKYSLINPSQFVFPTEEMRDAFYKNFKKEIEQCKEL